MNREELKELIYFDENNALNPEEIELNFIHDDLKGLNDIKKIDYDIQVDNLDYSGLSTRVKGYYASKSGISSSDKICETQEIIDCLYDGEVYTFNNFYKLKLVKVCNAGFGLIPDRYMTKDCDKRVEKFKLINDFIDEINKTIDDQLAYDKKEEEKWKNQIEINMDKFDKAQCRNIIGIKPLRKLSRKINKLKRRYYKLLIKERKKLPSIDSLKSLYLDLLDFRTSYFKQYDYGKIVKEYKSKKYESVKNDSDNSRDAYVNEINDLIINVNLYGIYIDNLLREIKDWKIKRANDVYLIDSSKLKKDVLNQVSNEHPDYYKYYNLNCLFDYFRDTTILTLNKHIDKDIKRRKIVDGFVQYTPYALGGLLILITFGLQFSYNYSVLKEMWQRKNLYIIYGIILFFAVVTLVNLLRNVVQFYRPKRGKATKMALRVFLVFSFMAFSLHLYYLYRYDGYDDVYYYVDCKNNTIKLDGLRNREAYNYVIPEKIDNKKVTEITKLVFSKRDNLKTVTGDVTGITIDDKAFQKSPRLYSVELNGLNKVSKKCFYNDIKLEYVKGTNITNIEESGFENCNALHDVDISTVKTLKKKAFKNCNKLEFVTFYDDLEQIGNEAFMNCNKLYYDSLPLNIRVIGKSAFEECISIKSIVAGNLKKIDKDAFKNCFSIEIVNINDIDVCNKNDLFSIFGDTGFKNVKSLCIDYYPEVDDNLLLNNSKIQTVSFGNVKTIGANVFSGCSNLTEITITGNVESIGKGVFYKAAKLTNLFIEFSNSFKEIPDDAFYGCNELEFFSIPNTVTKIGNNAFQSCTSLNELEIPSNVEKIGDNCYAYCSELRSIKIDSSNIEFGVNAFNNCSKINTLETACVKNFIVKDLFTESYLFIDKAIINSDTIIPDNFFMDCSKLKDLTFNKKIIYIGNSAFENCVSLETIPNMSDLETIGENAFAHCSDLSEVDLGENISTISKKAFYNCISLKTLVIPSSIRSVNSKAFENCFGITDINVQSKNIVFDDDVFAGCSKVTKLSLSSANNIIVYKLLPDSFKNVLTTIELNEITTIPNELCVDCSSLNKVIISNVSNIGAGAFKNCVSLVTFNNNTDLLSIGEEAFSGCFNLKYFNCKLPNQISDKAFYNCSSLLESGIHENVVSIGSFAYNGCNSITDINLGKKIEFVGNSAFVNMNSLTNISVSKIYENMKLYELFGTKIQDITSFDIKDISVIPDEFFMDCINLITITHTNNIVKIGDKAFYNCSNFNDFSIIDNVEEIGSYAFYNCTNLTNLFLPKTVKKIGDSAFSGCNNLTSLTYYQLGSTDTIQSIIGVDDISRLLNITVYNSSRINDNFFNGCINVLSINLKNEVSFIGNYAFANCIKLDTLTCFGSISEIGDNAFYDCCKLGLDGLANNAVKIGKNAFYNCDNLTSINLSPLISEIGDNAFANCNKLESVSISNKNVKIGKCIFDNSYNIKNASLVFASTENFENYFSKDTGCLFDSLVFTDSNSIPNYYFKDINWLKNFDFSEYTKIGDYSFENTSIKVVDSESIIELGTGSFLNCKSLANVSLKNVNNLPIDVFKGCLNLVSVDAIKENATISSGAFEGCISLNNVDLVNVIKIEKNAFVKCSSLKELSFYNSKLELDKESFVDTPYITKLTIPAKYKDNQFVILSKYFEKEVLSNMTNLTLLNVRSLNSNSLKEFTSLTEIEINGIIDKIPSDLFKGKVNLEIVKLSDSIEVIDASAFEGCESLESINVPASLTRINELAFSGCNSLKSLVLNKNMEYIGDSVFAGNESLKLENITKADQNNQDKWAETWNSRAPKQSTSTVEIIVILCIVGGIFILAIIGFVYVVKNRKNAKKNVNSNNMNENQNNATNTNSNNSKTLMQNEQKKKQSNK